MLVIERSDYPMRSKATFIIKEGEEYLRTNAWGEKENKFEGTNVALINYCPLSKDGAVLYEGYIVTRLNGLYVGVTMFKNLQRLRTIISEFTAINSSEGDFIDSYFVEFEKDMKTQ